MFLTTVRKELLGNILSFRFTIAMILCVLLMLLSAYTLREKYERQLNEYSAAVITHRKKLDETGNIQNLMLEGYRLDKRPTPLTVLAIGLEGAGRTTTASVREEPSLEDGESRTEPLAGLFGTLDFAFITRIVISLLAILFTYDTIAGERERGTLKLMLSNAVPRDVVVMGKAVGAYVSLLLPFLVSVIVGFLVIVLSPEIQFDGESWQRVLLVLTTALLYIWVFTAIGLFISARTERANTALLSLLLIWVVFVLAIPKASHLVAGQIHPVPAVQEIQGQKSAVEQQINSEVDQQMLKMAQLGEKLYGEIAQEWMAQGKDPRQHQEEFQTAIMSAILERMTDIQKEALDKINMQRDQIEATYERKLRRQTELAMNLSRVSPASSFTLALTSLTNTGISRQQDFLKSAKQYKREFSKYLNTKLERGQGLGFNPHDPSDQLDLSDLPHFKSAEPTLAVSLNEAWLDILLLAVLGVVFSMAAYVSFLRYDVR